MSSRPQHFAVEKEFDALSVSKAWELLGNTEHLNRSIGLPAFTFGRTMSSDADLYRETSAKQFGMTLRWKEYPFEWIREQRYAVRRVFEGGPFAEFYGGVELRPGKTGCIVRVFADLTPRHVIGALLAPLIGNKGIRDTLRYCEKFLELSGDDAVDVLPRSRSRTPVNRGHLNPLLQGLARIPIPADLVAHLNRRLCEGTDEEVLRMRPRILAQTWGVDADEVLRMLLYATKSGILNLTWELICPNCRVPKAEYTTLAELSSDFHCDLCGVNYDANFDQFVELRFSVHPRVRQAVDEIYCIGGPYHAPHIIAQQYLAPGAVHTFSTPLTDAPTRLRILRHNDCAVLSPVKDSEAATTETLQFTYRDDGWYPQAQTYVPGLTSIELRNESSRIAIAVLEKSKWDINAVTAAYVTTLQEFRALFGSEVLAPGQQVSVESLSILFSDLKDSTPLYELIGDARAYGTVRKHFDFLIDIIAAHHGAVVKTIGDAVMAVFQQPENAVAAAMEIQEAVGDFNRKNEIEPPIVIKIGVYHGPAIAVNSNDRLDYFGRTVNIAARIQPQSVGGDVVIHADLFHDDGVQNALNGFSFAAIPFQATLKGIEGEFTLYRLRPKIR